MEGAVATVHHPNREKPESIKTRAVVVVLLLASAFLLAVITVGGWSVMQGLLFIDVFYVASYLGFAYLVERWNRGALALASALAIILVLFAILATPAWFDRDKSGFAEPLLPGSFLGLLTLAVIPLQALLVFFAMRGFKQNWNIEE